MLIVFQNTADRRTQSAIRATKRTNLSAKLVTKDSSWPKEKNVKVSVNALAPGRCGCNLKLINFKIISRIEISGISCEITRRWMPQDLTDDWSTLVQVMAWWCQATSQYLNQCWPSPMTSYGVKCFNDWYGSCVLILLFRVVPINYYYIKYIHLLHEHFIDR